MAKVSTATVRLVLKKNRKNKNDEYPVYIVVCFGGRVEKATGVSVKEKYWDANTIATYVHQLTKDKEIADMVENMAI